MTAFLAGRPKPYEAPLLGVLGWLAVMGFGLATDRALLPVALIATAVAAAINALWWGIEKSGLAPE